MGYKFEAHIEFWRNISEIEEAFWMIKRMFQNINFWLIMNEVLIKITRKVKMVKCCARVTSGEWLSAECEDITSEHWELARHGWPVLGLTLKLSQHKWLFGNIDKWRPGATSTAPLYCLARANLSLSCVNITAVSLSLFNLGKFCLRGSLVGVWKLYIPWKQVTIKPNATDMTDKLFINIGFITGQYQIKNRECLREQKEE